MKTTKIKTSLSEGWAVHIYDRDRHLCCTIDSSHGWVFSAGLSLGILAAIIATNLNPPTHTQPLAAVNSPPSATPAVTPEAIPSAEPEASYTPSEFMFWID